MIKSVNEYVKNFGAVAKIKAVNFLIFEGSAIFGHITWKTYLAQNPFRIFYNLFNTLITNKYLNAFNFQHFFSYLKNYLNVFFFFFVTSYMLRSSNYSTGRTSNLECLDR